MGPIVCGARSRAWRSRSRPCWWPARSSRARARERRGGGRRSALAVLARPEALLLVPFLAVRARSRGVVRSAAVPIVVVAPAVAFNLKTTGTPYPAPPPPRSRAVSSAGSAASASRCGAPVHQTPGRHFLPNGSGGSATIHGLLPIAARCGARPDWTYAGRRRSCGRARPSRAPPRRWRCSRRTVARPSRRGGTRSICCRSPWSSWRRRSRRWSRSRSRARRAYAWAGRRRCLVVGLAIAAGALVPAASRYAWAVQNIDAMQVHLGRWVADHSCRRRRGSR